MSSEKSSDDQPTRVICFQFGAKDLDKMDLVGSSDAYLQLVDIDSQRVMYRTQFIANQRNPCWPPFTISIEDLGLLSECELSEEEDVYVRAEVWDHNRGLADSFIGSTNISLARLLAAIASDESKADANEEANFPIIWELLNPYAKPSSKEVDRDIHCSGQLCLQKAFETVELYGGSVSLVTNENRSIEPTTQALKLVKKCKKPSLVLQFHASDLDNVDLIGKSDPFLVIVKVQDLESSMELSGSLNKAGKKKSQKEKTKKTVYKSETISNNLNPEWKEFVLSFEDLGMDMNTLLSLRVFDRDLIKANDEIGRVTTALGILVGAAIQKQSLSWTLENNEGDLESTMRTQESVDKKAAKQKQSISSIPRKDSGTEMGRPGHKLSLQEDHSQKNEEKNVSYRGHGQLKLCYAVLTHEIFDNPSECLDIMERYQNKPTSKIEIEEIEQTLSGARESSSKEDPTVLPTVSESLDNSQISQADGEAVTVTASCESAVQITQEENTELPQSEEEEMSSDLNVDIVDVNVEMDIYATESIGSKVDRSDHHENIPDLPKTTNIPVEIETNVVVNASLDYDENMEGAHSDDEEIEVIKTCTQSNLNQEPPMEFDKGDIQTTHADLYVNQGRENDVVINKEAAQHQHELQDIDKREAENRQINLDQSESLETKEPDVLVSRNSNDLLQSPTLESDVPDGTNKESVGVHVHVHDHDQLQSDEDLGAQRDLHKNITSENFVKLSFSSTSKANSNEIPQAAEVDQETYSCQTPELVENSEIKIEIQENLEAVVSQNVFDKDKNNTNNLYVEDDTESVLIHNTTEPKEFPAYANRDELLSANNFNDKASQRATNETLENQVVDEIKNSANSQADNFDALLKINTTEELKKQQLINSSTVDGTEKTFRATTEGIKDPKKKIVTKEKMELSPARRDVKQGGNNSCSSSIEIIPASQYIHDDSSHLSHSREDEVSPCSHVIPYDVQESAHKGSESYEFNSYLLPNREESGEFEDTCAGDLEIGWGNKSSITQATNQEAPNNNIDDLSLYNHPPTPREKEDMSSHHSLSFRRSDTPPPTPNELGDVQMARQAPANEGMEQYVRVRLPRKETADKIASQKEEKSQESSCSKPSKFCAFALGLLALFVAYQCLKNNSHSTLRPT